MQSIETRDQLEELARDLPDSLKAEACDFAHFLLDRELREEAREWNHFSLRRALQGLEQEEELYIEADLKVHWQ